MRCREIERDINENEGGENDQVPMFGPQFHGFLIQIHAPFRQTNQDLFFPMRSGLFQLKIQFRARAGFVIEHLQVLDLINSMNFRDAAKFEFFPHFLVRAIRLRLNRRTGFFFHPGDHFRIAAGIGFARCAFQDITRFAPAHLAFFTHLAGPVIKLEGEVGQPEIGAGQRDVRLQGGQGF